MKKNVTQRQCEKFILKQFSMIGPTGKRINGIEIGCFWRLVEKAGLWQPGIYGGPVSKALEKLVDVEDIHNPETGEFIYHIFKLKPEVLTDET